MKRKKMKNLTTNFFQFLLLLEILWPIFVFFVVLAIGTVFNLNCGRQRQHQKVIFAGENAEIKRKCSDKENYSHITLRLKV